MSARFPQSTPDVPLLQRPAGARREDEVGRRARLRGELVPHQHEAEFSRDRRGPCGAVGLRWSSIPAPVDLPAELDLGLVKIVDPHIGPGQSAKLRDSSACKSCDRKQRPERFARGRNRLLELLAVEDRSALRM